MLCERTDEGRSYSRYALDGRYFTIRQRSPNGETQHRVKDVTFIQTKRINEVETKQSAKNN